MHSLSGLGLRDVTAYAMLTASVWCLLLSHLGSHALQFTSCCPKLRSTIIHSTELCVGTILGLAQSGVVTSAWIQSWEDSSLSQFTEFVLMIRVLLVINKTFGSIVWSQEVCVYYSHSLRCSSLLSVITVCWKNIGTIWKTLTCSPHHLYWL